MSRAQVRPLTGSTAQQGIDQMLGALPGLVSDSLDQYVSLLRRGSRLLGGLLPTGKLADDGCCEVPTRDCPPRCVCEFDWQAAPGEAVRATIRVTNTSAQARDFTFSGSVLRDDQGNAPGDIAVTPASAMLASGQSVVLRVAIAVNDKYALGHCYAGEIAIRGAYEQCVCVRLCVERPPVPHCDVSQGDPPERITELHWYRHYQCTEPCAPPPRQPAEPAGTLARPQDTLTTPGRTPAG